MEPGRPIRRNPTSFESVAALATDSPVCGVGAWSSTVASSTAPFELAAVPSSVLAIDEELCLNIANEKLGDIKTAGADCITLVCPFCSIMYDDNQRKIESTFNSSYNLPVLFYPQLLGLAMGFDPREIGLNMNRVKPTELIAQM